MATKCDRECDRCKAKDTDRFVCLDSEEEFLASFLRLGSLLKGKTNLLGYAPCDLIDWYLYAKRQFSNRPSEDRIDWGRKLLDEIGKTVFDIDQVTWRQEGKAWHLLRPLENRLLNACLGPNAAIGDHELVVPSANQAAYESEKQAADCIRSEAFKDLLSPESKAKWRSLYEEQLECRIAYTELDLLLGFKLPVLPNGDLEVLVISSKPDGEDHAESKLRRARARLATVFIEGIARFAVSDEIVDRSRLKDCAGGYWLDKIDELPKAVVSVREPSKATGFRDETYCGLPKAVGSQMKFSTELAARFGAEYRTDAASCFRALFMCRQEDRGWFWVFTKAQIDALKGGLGQSDRERAISSLADFRLRVAGVINHLERSQNLVTKVDNFNREQFICVAAGYKLEDRADLAEAFEKLENVIPEVKDHVFYYYRLSSHSRFSDEATKTLPEAALVAVFPVLKNVAPTARLAELGRIRMVVEQWRASVNSGDVVKKVVLDTVRPHQEKTAKAAIMSRNLSHNVGSHALANSRFFESVGVLHEITNSPKESPSARKDEDSYDGGVFRHKETNFPLRNGEVWRARQRLAAFNGFIQGRLDFIARALGESSSPPEPLFFFGDLVQGFCSQRVLLNTLLSDNGIAIGNIEFHIKTPGMDGPSVYKGIPDNPNNPDHQLRHIHFDVAKDGGALCIKNTAEIKDVLISVPGGMVGRHAFYAFLENIMRNAAKYGERPDEKGESTALIIRLEVKEGVARKNDDGTGRKDVPCYWLEITDNRSIDAEKKENGKVSKNEGSISRRVRIHLNDPIITSQGKPQTEGHGIQEMKVCAGFLAGDDLVFPVDEEIHAGSAKVEFNGRTFWEDSNQSRDPYQAFITKRKEYLKETHAGDGNRTAWIGNSNALQAWDQSLDSNLNLTGKGKKCPHLAYRLILQKPVIFGIVDRFCLADGGTGLAEIRQAKHEPSVFFYRDILTLARNPAHFGLILANDASHAHDIIKQIALYHHALPYRLLIAVPNKKAAEGRTGNSIQEQFQVEIDSASASIDKNVPYSAAHESDFNNGEIPKGCLPARRVFVVTCDGLFNRGGKTPINGESFPSFSQQETKGGKRTAGKTEEPVGLSLFKTIYEAWLRAWKGEPPAAPGNTGKWNLWIGMDRTGADGVKEKWKALPQFDSNIVQVKVKAQEDSSGVLSRNYVEPTDQTPKRAFIVYDNHGEAFKKDANFGGLDSLGSGPTCYHSFSGSGQIELFHALDSPPQDAFGLAFHVFSLLEASLTTVIIVDERVAEAMVAKGTFSSRILFQQQLSRIFPLFQVRRGSFPEDKKPLSPEVAKALGYLCKEEDIREWQKELWRGEGLQIRHDGPSRAFVAGYFANRTQLRLSTLESHSSMNASLPDAIVVHEGVVDLLGDWWKRGTPDSFYAQTPFFVRTSGRGSGSRHEGDHLPFLEFSELSQNTYQSHNKVSLGRSLLSLRGNIQ